jgi:hypothetical protein
MSLVSRILTVLVSLLLAAAVFAVAVPMDADAVCETKEVSFSNKKTDSIANDNQLESIGKSGTYNIKSGLVTYQIDKPVIRLFTTTTCPYSTWSRDVFDIVVTEFIQSGDIIAYHWDLDTGDNTITPEIETEVPLSELKILLTFNPEGSVPTFILGEKYWRVGNGYDRTNDLVSEELELRIIIRGLIQDSDLKMNNENYGSEFDSDKINGAVNADSSTEDFERENYGKSMVYMSLAVIALLSVLIIRAEVRRKTVGRRSEIKIVQQRKKKSGRILGGLIGLMILSSVLFLAVPSAVSAQYEDMDGDGFSVAGGDCDDYNSDIYPGELEILGDGVDNDCDGMIDETIWYRDYDKDSYGHPTITIESETWAELYTDNNYDCNDETMYIHPGAYEAYDGVDNNCDGRIDEGYMW